MEEAPYYYIYFVLRVSSAIYVLSLFIWAKLI